MACTFTSLASPLPPSSIHPTIQSRHCPTSLPPCCASTAKAASYLAALEEQNGHLAQVEVNKVAGLVRHIRSKVTSYDTMPCGIVFLVEFLFNVCCDILKNNWNRKRLVILCASKWVHSNDQVSLFSVFWKPFTNQQVGDDSNDQWMSSRWVEVKCVISSDVHPIQGVGWMDVERR